MLTLTGGWLATFGLLMLVGLVRGQGLLVGLGALVLLTWLVAWGWNRVCLARVTFERSLSVTRAFIGDTVSVQLRVTNRKAIPMPWVTMEDQFPTGLEEAGKPRALRVEQGTYSMTRATSLARYERVTWRFVMECRRRGLYRFGPAVVMSGDVFGFFFTERQETAWQHVIVYPQTLPLPTLGIPARRPFGELRGGQPYHEDPSRLRGLRLYEAGDALRRVDWKATARAQALTVRLFAPSVSETVIVVLNAQTLTVSEGQWGYSPVLLERGVTAAASIAEWASANKIAFGFLTNCVSPLTDEPIRVMPNRTRQQFTTVLESLAVVTPVGRQPMAQFIIEQTRQLPAGATIVMVTSVLDEATITALRALRRHGARLSIVWTAETPPPPMDAPGITVYEIGQQMARLEREAVFRPGVDGGPGHVAVPTGAVSA